MGGYYVLKDDSYWPCAPAKITIGYLVCYQRIEAEPWRQVTVARITLVVTYGDLDSTVSIRIKRMA